MLVVLGLCAGEASAEPESPTIYRARVADARTLLASARANPPSLRLDPVGRARTLLAQGGEVRVADRVLRADDPSIAAALVASDDASLDRAVAACDRLIAQLDDVLAARGPDGRTIDASLAAVRRTYSESAGGASLGALVLDRVADWLRSMHLPIISPLAFLGLFELPVFLLALAIVGALVTTLGRGIRERIRRETLLPSAAFATARGGDPDEQLRRADAALASGEGREAIHALYQYAIAALTAREAIRFDPALTDRELLGRAAGVPHVESLRALVALHERVWFGLRMPAIGEPARARAWALEVGA